MTNINLYQKDERVGKYGPKKRIVNEGFFISIGLLFIVLGFLIGIKLYSKSLDKSEADIDRRMAEVEEEMRREDIGRLADFYFRKNFVEDFLRNREATSSVLGSLEKSMVSGVIARSMSFDKDSRKIQMDLYSDGFNSVAKEILSLKNKGYFDNIKLNKASKEDNVVSFSVDGSIK